MQRLGPRIFVFVLGLLLATLGVTFFLVDRTTYNQALDQIHSELQAAHGIFVHQLESRHSAQRQLTAVVANDFGLKDEIARAVAGSDSLRVTLDNFRTRSGARWAIATDNDGHLLATTDDAYNEGAAQLASYTQGNDRNDLIVYRIGESLYQVSFTPVYAPRPQVIGWLALGFALDDALLDEFEAETNTSVSLVETSMMSHRVVASSTSKVMRDQIALHDLTAGFGIVELGADQEVLFTAKLEFDGTVDAAIVMQRSLSSSMTSFSTLRMQLLGIISMTLVLAAFVAWWLARGVSRPLELMASYVRRLGDGDFNASPPSGEKGEVGTLALAFTEMQAGLSDRDEKLRHLAFHDPLTGLANRNLLIQTLDQWLERGTRCAVIALDLDHFSDINNTLGHDVGDQVLAIVGKRLLGGLREGDLLARLGGSQFAALIEAESTGDALAASNRLSDRLADPIHIDQIALEVIATMGIAMNPEHGDTSHTLVQHAEIASHNATVAERESVQFYDVHRDHHTRQRLALMSEIRGAITRDEMQMFVQPKLDLSVNKIVAVECLVRWLHPVHGFVPPAEFINLAEQTGHIRQLTAWMLKTGIRWATRWLDLGLHIRCAINISTVDLLDSKFPALVRMLLEEHHLPPELLQLEVTESAAMTDPSRSLKHLAELKALGIGLSIDDYGTGHSSMAQLKDMPVGELKIDQAFTRRLATSEKDQIIVLNTIGLAHSMQLRVVAEGVEDEAALLLLRQFHCDEVQGYHLARPMPVGRFEEWATTSPYPLFRSDKQSDAA